MSILLIAIGNVYRRDDGVAHRVLELLSPPPSGVTLRNVLQLTPELSEEITFFDQVVFIDADIEPGKPSLIPVEADPLARSPLGHHLGPEEVLVLARKLYDFGGKAWLCRIPSEDFSEGEGLSEVAENHAYAACSLLLSFIAS